MYFPPGYRQPRHHPSTERMEDLPVNPVLLAQWKEQEEANTRAEQRTPAKKAAPAPRPARTHTRAPQLSTAQRRRNQAGQPRETDGKYAGKPESKWKQFLSGESAPHTSLNKIAKKPAQVAQPMKKRSVPMSLVEHRNPLVKAHWWITRGFRQWRRKKARQIRKAFSLRG